MNAPGVGTYPDHRQRPGALGVVVTKRWIARGLWGLILSSVVGPAVGARKRGGTEADDAGRP